MVQEERAVVCGLDILLREAAVVGSVSARLGKLQDLVEWRFPVPVGCAHVFIKRLSWNC